MRIIRKNQVDFKKVKNFIQSRVPFLKKVGISVEAISRGRIKLGIPRDRHNLNHFGTYQAGVYLTLAETAGASLLATLIDLSDVLLLTKECHLTFGKPAKNYLSYSGFLNRQESRKIHSELNEKRKMDVIINVQLLNEHGEIAANGSITYYLRKDSSEIIRNMQANKARRYAA